MRRLYTIALYLLVPLVIFRLWWRGRKNPDYRKRIAERFGFFSRLPEKKRIWLHSVSVGETIAAAPLIKKLLAEYPDYSLLITTTTPTGSAQLKRLFGEQVEHVYFPYDLPDVIHRFFHRAQPDILIVMETELWPNLYSKCAQQKIPVLVANARLSPRSLAGYAKISGVIRAVLGNISIIAPQSEADAERFKRLGADKKQIHICGNIKFDLQIPVEAKETGEALKRKFGNRPVWIAASTHDGEDAQILSAHRNILGQLPDALLILVPRHPERFNEVARLCQEEKFSMTRRSRNDYPDANTQVYLGDTMGELLQLYAAADVAFVAGSLVPTGGHNPLEPAALGLPVLTGPHVFNFAEIVDALQVKNAMNLIHSSRELAERVTQLLQQPEERSVLGEAGRQLVTDNRGAADCLLGKISDLLAQD